MRPALIIQRAPRRDAGGFRWSDIGNWAAIFDVAERDAAGNATRGPAVTLDAQDCLIHAEEVLTAVVGVKDLVVVASPDAVLVLPRERAEAVKELVAALKQGKHPEATDHRRVYRPWGHYGPVDAGERFQVKRLVVAWCNEIERMAIKTCDRSPWLEMIKLTQFPSLFQGLAQWLLAS